MTAIPGHPLFVRGRYPQAVTHDPTTQRVQRHLDELAAGAGADDAIRGLLEQAVQRLHLLCGGMLHRHYPRLLRPPLAMRTEELTSAVVERLLRALRAVRPGNVRQFFALANQHIRWELNDLARRLDNEPGLLHDVDVAAPAPSSRSGVSARLDRILTAIDALPEGEREVFGLVNVQGLSHAEAAALLQVSTKTVQRRLHRGLVLLAEALDDLRPEAVDGAG